MNEVFVAGRLFGSKEKGYKFDLMRPSGAGPYYTLNECSSSMRLLGDNGSALYKTDRSTGRFTNMNNSGYGKSYDPEDLDYEDRCPSTVTDKALMDSLFAAIEDGTARQL